jgi:hypothetical protein
MSEISIPGLSGSLRSAPFRLSGRSMAEAFELIGRYLRSKAMAKYRLVGYEKSAVKARNERAPGKTSNTISRHLFDRYAAAAWPYLHNHKKSGIDKAWPKTIGR